MSEELIQRFRDELLSELDPDQVMDPAQEIAHEQERALDQNWGTDL